MKTSLDVQRFARPLWLSRFARARANMEPTPPMLPRPGNRRPLRMWRGLTQASIAEGMSKDHEDLSVPLGKSGQI